MKPITFLTRVAILTLPLLAAAQQGTVPLDVASKYAAHAESDGASIGAVLLTPREVHKAFSTDLTRCCLVVEVAVYPGKGKPMDVSPDDFILRLAGADTAVKPSSARLLAAELQKKNGDSLGITTVTEAHIGYESGISPLTGQRIHGVESGIGVGVGMGGEPAAAPASTLRDRDVMELELHEKALPDETTAAPVAGYLYFALSKDNKKASHQLEYTLNGQKVLLKLD